MNLVSLTLNYSKLLDYLIENHLKDDDPESFTVELFRNILEEDLELILDENLIDPLPELNNILFEYSNFNTPVTEFVVGRVGGVVVVKNGCSIIMPLIFVNL